MQLKKTVRKRTPKNTATIPLFATTFAGLEDVLVKELTFLGAKKITKSLRGVSFYGDKKLIYSGNLWLRTAHRILMPIATFPAKDRVELYNGTRTINWDEHLSTTQTLAIDTVTNKSDMDHSQFASQVVKDGIVDFFRDKCGQRPNVDRENPSLRINAHILENKCTLSIDTSGHRLHQRGYRPTFGADAPLKENLAAGILLLAGYTGKQSLVDPMCGSGTLIIEAAMIAKNIVPGLLKQEFGFMNHPSFEKQIWNNLLSEAKAAVSEQCECNIYGYDISDEAVRASCSSALGAGVDDVVCIRKAKLSDFGKRDNGMIITNPPYGERLGELEKLAELYENLGSILKHNCQNCTAHILTSSKFLANKIGLKTKKRDILWNGALECRLLHYDIY